MSMAGRAARTSSICTMPGPAVEFLEDKLMSPDIPLCHSIVAPSELSRAACHYLPQSSYGGSRKEMTILSMYFISIWCLKDEAQSNSLNPESLYIYIEKLKVKTKCLLSREK